MPMRILMVNTYHYHRGGAPVYVFNLTRLLQQRGHVVVHFAMSAPQNLPCPFQDYFVSFIDFREMLARPTPKNFLRVASRVFYFREAREKLERLLRDHPVDVVHLHNFLHHLTLSVVDAVRARGIPMVWSLHDHILVCPNTNLFDDRRGEPCARCRNTLLRLLLPPLRRCKKGSLGASIMASLEAFYIACRKPHKIPERFISPSRFLVEQHRLMGFPDVSRFEVVPNFVMADLFKPNPQPGDYALYFGRLSVEKGLEHLVRAFGLLGRRRLVVAGEGPDAERLRALAEKLGAPVEFVGFVRGERLRELVSGCRFVVLPSVCFENAPLMVLEAFAAAKPVLASRIGGIPELVDEGVGALFEPASPQAIAQAVDELWEDTKKIEAMGKRARHLAETKFSPQVHVERILGIYGEALKAHTP